MEDKLKEELKAISELLDVALQYGMELEVIYFALKAMKENSQLSPAEAFAIGITEWVK